MVKYCIQPSVLRYHWNQSWILWGWRVCIRWSGSSWIPNYPSSCSYWFPSYQRFCSFSILRNRWVVGSRIDRLDWFWNLGCQNGCCNGTIYNWRWICSSIIQVSLCKFWECLVWFWKLVRRISCLANYWISESHDWKFYLVPWTIHHDWHAWSNYG